MISLDDVAWCDKKCHDQDLWLFSSSKMEAFCERVAIKIESGISEDDAREQTFKHYTGGLI